VSLNASALTFASQTVGVASGADAVTLTNSGTGPLTVTGISITGANAADFTQTNTCATSIATGAQCSISVTFKPTAAGSRSAAISIADNATGSPQSITLTGAGVGAPLVSLSASALTFASQSVGVASGSQAVTMTNSGTGPLTVTGISIAGVNAADFTETNTCGTSVAAGAQCSISVTFKPTAAGARSAAISIADNAAGSPQSITLTGTGAAVAVTPVFTSSVTAPATLAAGATAPLSVTVKETGSGALTNGNVELQVFNSAGTAVLTQYWSSQSFTSGQSRTYNYSWTPAATLPAGSYTVDVGVFSSSWSQDYYWNTGATVTVTAAAHH
jgi:hypothetical protein